MAKLYEIDQALEALMEGAFDPETGEILEDAYEKIEALQEERTAKIEGIALWIKNLKADAAAYKEEKMVFAERQRVAENQIDRLETFLTRYLAGEKLKTTRVSISYRSSQAVEVEDLTAIPVEFLLPADPKPDRAAIKAAIKDGMVVPGARLEDRTSIQIK